MGVNGGLPFKVCHSGLMGKSNAQPGPLRMHPRDEATLHHACVMLGNVTDFNVRNCAYMRLDLAPTVTRPISTTPSMTKRGGLVCLNSAARFDKWNRAAVR